MSLDLLTYQLALGTKVTLAEDQLLGMSESIRNAPYGTITARTSLSQVMPEALWDGEDDCVMYEVMWDDGEEIAVTEEFEDMLKVVEN